MGGCVGGGCVGGGAVDRRRDRIRDHGGLGQRRGGRRRQRGGRRSRRGGGRGEQRRAGDRRLRGDGDLVAAVVVTSERDEGDETDRPQRDHRAGDDARRGDQSACRSRAPRAPNRVRGARREHERDDRAHEREHDADQRPHEHGDRERFDLRLPAPTALARSAARRTRGFRFRANGDHASVVWTPRGWSGCGHRVTLPTVHPRNGAPRRVARVDRLLAMATAVLPVTGDPEADELLVSDPFALLVGMLLDQQVPMEWAFRGPATLRGRLGTLDAKSIAAMSPEEVDAVFRQKPALHRYPGSMAKRTYSLATHIVDQYDGDAAAIWRDVQDPKELFDRLARAPRLRRGEGEDLPRHPREAARRRASGLGAVRGTVRRLEPTLGGRHRLARSTPARAAWKQEQKKAGKTKSQESVSS